MNSLSLPPSNIVSSDGRLASVDLHIAVIQAYEYMHSNY